MLSVSANKLRKHKVSWSRTSPPFTHPKRAVLAAATPCSLQHSLELQPRPGTSQIAGAQGSVPALLFTLRAQRAPSLGCSASTPCASGTGSNQQHSSTNLLCKWLLHNRVLSDCKELQVISKEFQFGKEACPVLNTAHLLTSCFHRVPSKYINAWHPCWLSYDALYHCRAPVSALQTPLWWGTAPLSPTKEQHRGIAPSSQQLSARFQPIFARKLGQQLTTSVARLQIYNWAIQTFFWWQHSGKRGAKASGFTREKTGPYFSRWLHHKSFVWIRIFISHLLQHTHTRHL